MVWIDSPANEDFRRGSSGPRETFCLVRLHGWEWHRDAVGTTEPCSQITWVLEATYLGQVI